MSFDADWTHVPLERPVLPHELARILTRNGADGVILFDATRSPFDTPEHSYVACSPADVLREREPGVFVDAHGERVEDALAWMNERALRRRGDGFCGGVAGLGGFEIAWLVDPPLVPRPEMRTPALWAGAYEAIARHDRETGEWFVCGGPECVARATLESALRQEPGAAPKGRLDAPAMVCDGDPEVVYPEVVEVMREAIRIGDLFEVNYAERLEARWEGEPIGLYEAMRARSTGAHFGYLDAGAFQICSVSPERFVAVSDGVASARPIKGSRARHEDPVVDAEYGRALVESVKDRAENVMIVDLMRNDLTKVCRIGTVRATEVCALESFAGIHHLVSTIEGVLSEEVTPLDALLACSPAGSITGAPKLRSIEYIATHEHTSRGAYTGSLFWASGRDLDASVLIRTAELVDGVARYGAGGAVVYASDPVLEYEEAMLKARPLLAVRPEDV